MTTSALLVLWLAGCEYGMTLPSNDPAPEGEKVPGFKYKVRERVPILPGSTSAPPPPEPGVTAEDCKKIEDGGSIHGPGCITSELHCGDTLVGSTIGGVKRFDSQFYESKFCTPGTTNHDGGDERVYRLEMPDGEWTAFITLDTPCADLDIAAMLHDGEDCPTAGHTITRCDMWPQDGTAREHLQLTTQGTNNTWFVVVEGKDSEEGAFSLSVQCRQGMF